MKISGHEVFVREGFRASRNWAVFLDRDGVLNEEVHLLSRAGDLRLVKGAAAAVRALNERDVPAVIVHNAAVVSRGLCGVDEENALTAKLLEMLRNEGAVIDAVFSCPHHPTAFDSRFKKDCGWRKPKSGMLKKAAALFGLDLKKCYLVGDTSRDILAGQGAGTFSLLVRTGHGGKDLLHEANPDRTCADLLDAVNFVLEREGLT